MNAELAKAHEHTKRFQEVLGMERRKQKSLKVIANNSAVVTYKMLNKILITACLGERITRETGWIRQSYITCCIQSVFGYSYRKCNSFIQITYTNEGR